MVCGKFLHGATVLITSRPTAEHIYLELPFDINFEILGFTKPEIEDYVKKFCPNDNDMSTRMWNLIQGSAELLSLCYIPVQRIKETRNLRSIFSASKELHFSQKS